MTRGIDVTVAAIIERDGKFLMVEERAGGKLVLNQPAGHLEQGESLLAAAAREALEETGHRFEPEHVVGFYLWRSEEADTTYLSDRVLRQRRAFRRRGRSRRRHRRRALAHRAPSSLRRASNFAARWWSAASTTTSRVNATRSIA